MRLPFVSVAWKDAYEAERAEVRRLTDALIRLERHAAGLSEAPIEKKPRILLPLDLEMKIEAMWSNSNNVAAEKRRAASLYERLKDWGQVEAELLGGVQEVTVE
jgi:hypothetical protein